MSFSRVLGGSERRKDETLLTKYLAVPFLVLATCLSFALLGMNRKNWSRPMSFVTSHPSLVGIFVQIISYLLGLIYTYALGKSAGPDLPNYILTVWASQARR
jgi:hypothetical protein